MKRPKASNTGGGFVNQMTPMIDVIFQLQIFFLCTAGFTAPEALLPTELPAAGVAAAKRSAEPLDLEIVRVRLRGVGVALERRLNDRPLPDRASLAAALVKLGRVSTALPVVLDVGPEVLLEDLVAVYDDCLSAGLSKINFAALKSEPAGREDAP
ncbi:MAG: ExbD/TolR family protein [Planctomycetia bacterium]